MTRTDYANGTYLRTSTVWDVYSGGAAMCADGIVRALKRIAITADTFYSIPAAVSVRGVTVSGYVTVDDTANDDKSVIRFTATGKNAGMLQCEHRFSTHLAIPIRMTGAIQGYHDYRECSLCGKRVPASVAPVWYPECEQS